MFVLGLKTSFGELQFPGCTLVFQFVNAAGVFIIWIFIFRNATGEERSIYASGKCAVTLGGGL